MSSITNLINGINIECMDEDPDLRNPAKVVITDSKGKRVALVYATKDKTGNAFLPVIRFTLEKPEQPD